jgi:oxygen-dependent protoporphyrinogen oxidase
MTAQPHVVVVGGGISALAAAFQLTGGDTPSGVAGPRVTILERDARLGGKIGSTQVNGRTVDAAADGVLARRPEAVALVDDLGCGDRLRPVGASGASVFARGRLRPLPAGLNLGIPTSWNALRRSGTLGAGGLARALVDLLAPRSAAPVDGDDAPVGALVGAKLGDEVVTTLVDPMLGGIYAGRVGELGAATVFPGLVAAAAGRGSLMRALRPPASGNAGAAPTATEPVFVSLDGGMHSLPGLLADELRRRGVEIVTGAEVTTLGRLGTPAAPTAGWQLTAGARTLTAEGVVLCVPAGPAADLLRDAAPEAASLLEPLAYASVGVVTFAFPPGSLTLPTTGTGVLVPAGLVHRTGPRNGERWLTTALTFLDRKWPELAQPGETLLRASVGRIDDPRLAAMTDDELVRVAREELDELLGPTPTPLDVSVTRWVDALPQYPVHHLEHVATIRAEVSRLGGIELAGAAYEGVGIPACIGSGRAAADRLLAGLAKHA